MRRANPFVTDELGERSGEPRRSAVRSDQLVQSAQRRAEDRQQTPDLAAAAAGQYRDQQLVRSETVRRPKAPAVAVVGAAFQNRMTDKAARQPDPLEVGRLERQQGHQ